MGTDIELLQVDIDRYGRSVAEVFKNEVNVNQFMVKKGQAIVYHKYLSNCPDGDAYIQAENAAKNQKLGFWNDSSFIIPEDWRRGKRPVVGKPQEVINQPASNSSGRGYVSGSCKYLRSLGLSRFTPGDANYTRRRDRDGDGVACE